MLSIQCGPGGLAHVVALAFAKVIALEALAVLTVKRLGCADMGLRIKDGGVGVDP
jgi:hypothetical protein